MNMSMGMTKTEGLLYTKSPAALSMATANLILLQKQHVNIAIIPAIDQNRMAKMKNLQDYCSVALADYSAQL